MKVLNVRDEKRIMQTENSNKRMNRHKNKKLTVRVKSHTRRCYVSGNCEIRQPKIFDVGVSKSCLNGLIKIATAEHRSHWICQIQDLAPPLGHFLSHKEA
jgi:hypothetical protein